MKEGWQKKVRRSLCVCVITKRPGQRCLAEPRGKKCVGNNLEERKEEKTIKCLLMVKMKTHNSILGLLKESVVLYCGGEEKRWFGCGGGDL